MDHNRHVHEDNQHTGCTASRDRQYKPIDRLCGVHLHRNRLVSDLGEKNRVINTPNDIIRCHPLDGSALPGVTGTGITGARISNASSHGIFGATSSRSPSHIEATAFGITGSTSSWITGASAGPTASHETNGIARSSPSGTTGP